MKKLIIAVLLLTCSLPSYPALVWGSSTFKKAPMVDVFDLKHPENVTSFSFEKPIGINNYWYQMKHRFSMSNHISRPPKLTTYFDVLWDTDIVNESMLGVCLGYIYEPDKQWTMDLGLGARGQEGISIKGGIDYVW